MATADTAVATEVERPRRRWLSVGAGNAVQVAPYLLLLALVLIGPLILLVTYSLRESSFLQVGPGPTLDQYSAIFDDPVTMRVIFTSLGVGFTVALVTTVLAFVLSYGIRFRFSQRTGFIALGVVMVAGIASFLVRIYAWGTILGTNGLINSALKGIGLIDEPLGFLFFGYFSIITTMVYLYLPLTSLMVISAMQEVDPRDVEASRDLGAGRWRTALRVVAPQAKIGLISSFALTAILACSDFITPQLVGGTRGQMAGTLIQSLALTNGNYPRAAALALAFLMMILIALALLAIAFRITRRPRAMLSSEVDRFASRLAPRLPTFASRLSFSKPLAILLLVFLVAPTLVVIVFSFNSGTTLGLPWHGFTLEWYPHVIDKIGFTEALLTSVKITVVAVGAGVLIGVPMAFALARTGGKRGALLRSLVFLPYAVPGVLIGVAILIGATDAGIQLGVSVTTFLHMLVVAPVVILIVNARLSGLDPRLLEAARDLGAARFRALRTITLPLILPSIIGAALIGAAYSLDEILATSFTIGTSTTIPIWLFGQARTGFTPDINALGVLLMIGTLVIFSVAALVLRRAFLSSGGRSM